MRIVDRKTFLAMPAGTVFSKYAPCYFEELCIKEDTLEQSGDFISQSIADAVECSGHSDMDIKLGDAERGASLSMDFDSAGRDGCFDDHQLFAVWERSDVEALIKRLQQTLK